MRHLNQAKNPNTEVISIDSDNKDFVSLTSPSSNNISLMQLEAKDAQVTKFTKEQLQSKRVEDLKILARDLNVKATRNKANIIQVIIDIQSVDTNEGSTVPRVTF